MIKYKFKISLPGWYTRQGLENTATGFLHARGENINIYNALANFEDKLLSSVLDSLVKDRVGERISLKEIINIHDFEGLKDRRKIRRMNASIDDGRDIINRAGFPNIKILRLKNNQLFLFDGHHSFLAYMLAGRKYLHQIPHIIVECKDEKKFLDHNFHHFFGGYLKWKRRETWKNYTINWNARGQKKLQERRQKNMGELFSVLLKHSRI